MNAETLKSVNHEKTKRALEVVFMWMAANVYDAGKYYASQVETLSKAAQICKTASIIINPRLKAFFPMIQIYKAADEAADEASYERFLDEKRLALIQWYSRMNVERFGGDVDAYENYWDRRMDAWGDCPSFFGQGDPVFDAIGRGYDRYEDW